MKWGRLLLCALSLGIAALFKFDGLVSVIFLFCAGMNYSEFAHSWLNKGKGEGDK